MLSLMMRGNLLQDGEYNDIGRTLKLFWKDRACGKERRATEKGAGLCGEPEALMAESHLCQR